MLLVGRPTDRQRGGPQPSIQLYLGILLSPDELSLLPSALPHCPFSSTYHKGAGCTCSQLRTVPGCVVLSYSCVSSTTGQTSCKKGLCRGQPPFVPFQSPCFLLVTACRTSLRKPHLQSHPSIRLTGFHTTAQGSAGGPSPGSELVSHSHSHRDRSRHATPGRQLSDFCCHS